MVLKVSTFYRSAVFWVYGVHMVSIWFFNVIHSDCNRFQVTLRFYEVSIIVFNYFLQINTLNLGK